MKTSVIVQPAALPVSLADLRAHLWNIYDNHDDDVLMTDLLTTATGRAETITGRKLITQTCRALTTETGMIQLPFGEFQSLVTVEWFDGTDWAEISTDDILVNDTKTLAEITVTWTGYDITDLEKVRYDWICGFGDPVEVPAEITMAIKQIAAHWYRNRAATTTDEDDGAVRVVPFSFSALLNSHRLNLII